ncbi:MAG TPA: PilZ domain-containing protein [Candidatus Limnocylindria bacterium]|nr:PilZ domain-containing protein [Candidatus Limnocylindria bacterium]
MAEEEEKRAAGAVRLRKFIEVVVEDARSFTLFRAVVADVSETGMRVISEQYLPKGTRYTFTFKRSPFLTVRGEVRWVRPFERDTFQLGVLFVDVADADRRRLHTFLEIERARVPTS